MISNFSLALVWGIYTLRVCRDRGIGDECYIVETPLGAYFRLELRWEFSLHP